MRATHLRFAEADLDEDAFFIALAAADAFATRRRLATGEAFNVRTEDIDKKYPQLGPLSTPTLCHLDGDNPLEPNPSC
jgi:hypothetical protein